jgi:hypothetical protein
MKQTSGIIRFTFVLIFSFISQSKSDRSYNPKTVLEKITIIDHSGAIHYETIGELIHQFKNHVHILGVHIGTYKKVLLVMIESLENIMKYAEYPSLTDGNPDAFIPQFSVRKEGERYFVSSSNTLETRNIRTLDEKLVYLNSLDQQGIKEYYKETITNGQFSQQGGAGLGLIEMAKISGNKIDFKFQQVDDSYTLFNLKITVDEFPNYP